MTEGKALILNSAEATLLLKAGARPSLMAMTIATALWMRMHVTEESRYDGKHNHLLEKLCTSIQALRQLENASRTLSGLDYMNMVAEACECPEAMKSLFQAAGLALEVKIPARDENDMLNHQIAKALQAVNLKTGLICVLKVCAEEEAGA